MSGFYKLLAAFMQMCQRLSYFGPRSIEKSDNLMFKDHAVMVQYIERNHSIELIQKFSIEVSLIYCFQYF